MTMGIDLSGPGRHLQTSAAVPGAPSAWVRRAAWLLKGQGVRGLGFRVQGLGFRV